MGPIQTPTERVPVALNRGEEQPALTPHQSPPSNAEVKNEGS